MQIERQRSSDGGNERAEGMERNRDSGINQFIYIFLFFFLFEMQIKQNQRSIAIKGMEKPEKCKSPRDLDMTPRLDAQAHNTNTTRFNA